MHPKCPAREQKPPKKYYVKKALAASALVPPPTSPPKGHRPRSRTRRSHSESRGKSQDKALESLNSTPGTASKTSTTSLGLIPPKEHSRECGETRTATSQEASASWTDASG
ncbi:hypothetical protein MRX96_051121 [Rhipicephalus microplus]